MTDTDIPLPSLAGRRAVLTGGSDGMGLVIAERLAAAGAEVVLPVRNRAKGDRAVRTIRERVPGGRVELHDLDLSSLASVADFAGALRADGRPVHLLVNNAGVMTPPERQTTADGFELQFGTNHLGHVALVGGILPLLTAGDARVVTQLSIAARSGAIGWNDLDGRERYDGMAAYNQSKLAVALFARELDARSREGQWAITSNLAHPGISPTNLLAAQPGMGREKDTGGRRVVGLLSRLGIAGTPETAALPALMAATDPAALGDEFYGPIRVIGGRPARKEFWAPMRSMADARRLWEASERLTGARFAV